MLFFEQLDFFGGKLAGLTVARASAKTEVDPSASRGRDIQLEANARELLRGVSAGGLPVHVEWNLRLRTAAGRADFHKKLISLNPRLHEYGATEIERTFRHELAHLLAHFRAGRRRISPHGPEWRQACRDLGIGDEQRCHTLPFPTQPRLRRFLYWCPRCEKNFPRVRRIRRASACLACCRRHNSGRYDRRFQLQLMRQAM